jgi:chemotaxis signal transduction protein
MNTRRPRDSRSGPLQDGASKEVADATVQLPPAGGNGDSLAAPMVNLDALLAEISARLVAAGSVNLVRPRLPTPPVEQLRIVVFVLHGTRYAVEIRYVNQVLRQAAVTRVPGLPDWVVGVLNLYGEIVSVVDLARFLDLDPPAAPSHSAATILVAQAADQRIGLMVDSVEVIYAFPAEQVISPPFKVEPSLVSYLRGAVERNDHFIRLLDCERLLLGPQMQQFS